jgi:hypothetical protein
LRNQQGRAYPPQIGSVVRLNDNRRHGVSILPTWESHRRDEVKGHSVLRFPFNSAAEYKGGTGRLGSHSSRAGDVLDEPAFYANGTRAHSAMGRYFEIPDVGPIDSRRREPMRSAWSRQARVLHIRHGWGGFPSRTPSR